MDSKLDTGYCVSCGKNVKVFGLLAEGDQVYRCVQCGMEVDPTQKEVPKTPASTHETQKQSQSSPQPLHKKLHYVMVAEDSKLLSEMVNDLLIEKGFAEQVSSSLDGDIFLQKFTEAMIKKDPPNLIILDINLPAIDGMNICIAIRAIEKAFGIKKGRPIIFFTTREIDSHLKKIIETYAPARYINKGSEADPEKLAYRIQKVMETLLK